MTLQVRPSYRSKKRKRRNVPEFQFRQLAEAEGWKATKRGWPDFLCWDEDGPFVVEVKRRTKSGRLVKLRQEQIETLDWMKSLGVRCFVSDGETIEIYGNQS